MIAENKLLNLLLYSTNTTERIFSTRNAGLNKNLTEMEKLFSGSISRIENLTKAEFQEVKDIYSQATRPHTAPNGLMTSTINSQMDSLSPSVAGSSTIFKHQQTPQDHHPQQPKSSSLKAKLSTLLKEFEILQRSFASSQSGLTKIQVLRSIYNEVKSGVSREAETLDNEQHQLIELKSKLSKLKADFSNEQDRVLDGRVKVTASLKDWFHTRDVRSEQQNNFNSLKADLQILKDLEKEVEIAIERRRDSLLSAKHELDAAHSGRVKSLKASSRKVDQIRTETSVTAQANLVLVRELKKEEEYVSGVIRHAAERNETMRKKLMKRGLPLNGARSRTCSTRGVDATGGEGVENPVYLPQF